MSKHRRRYKLRPKDNITPRSTCPTCGAGAYNSHRGRIKVVHGRPRRISSDMYYDKAWRRRAAGDRPVRIVSSIRVYGYKVVHANFGRTSRTWAECADPWHDRKPVEHKVIPPKVHNPDLREHKQRLNRAMQGKHRR